MDPIFNLLTELSTDPFLQDAFGRDPAAVMARAGLTGREQALLLAGQAGGATDDHLSGWIPCLTCGDPGPDPFEDPDPPGMQA